jgi:D-alanine-D-alanine ligase-like ATP-grasp enzyme
MDPNRKQMSFEIFGYDFLLDENLKPWLIEVNTNPCLELSAPYIARLIPAMVENAIK